jgi:predicted RNase H-like HicB family nuclease
MLVPVTPEEAAVNRTEFAILDYLGRHATGLAALTEIYEGMADLATSASRYEPESKRQVRRCIANLVYEGALERVQRGRYLLTPKGRERFLRELAEQDPGSPLLRRKLLILQTVVEAQPEGGYLAYSEAIRGCHAEGETVADALANLEDVARILLELREEDGSPMPEGLHEFKPGDALRSQLLVPVPE